MNYLKISKYFIALVILVGVIYFVVGNRDESQTSGNNDIGVVKRQDLIQRVTISGQLWPRRRLDIKPPFVGYVEKIYVKIGDKVKAGMPLVTFSPSLGKGETNFPVRAAFDGVVTQIMKAEGEYVAESGDQSLVVRVEDLAELFVRASVPELDITKLKVGQEATVRISSLVGETFKGRLSEIALSARDKDRWASSSSEFQLKVLLANHDARFLPGMSALMDVITQRADQVLTLPHEYIYEEDGKYSVTTASGEKKDIVVGLQTDEAAEIKSGLSEGEKIQVIDFLSLSKTSKAKN